MEFLTEPRIFAAGIFFANFIFTTLCFSLLVSVGRSHTSFFKKYLYISARKSRTNAVQLGGIPLSIGFYAVIATFLSYSNFHDLYLGPQWSLVKFWTVSSTIVVFYGYLDDKFELRPIVKLGFQFFCVLSYSIMSSKHLYSDFSTIAFLVLSFWGFGMLNGGNLLDGLDTLTIKVSLVSMLSYVAIGVYYSLGSVNYLSVGFCVPIVAFYYFNKEPAKVHLGEIGGSFIGFSGLLLSSLVFFNLKKQMYIFDAAFIALLPMTLPMCELGISFLRRIYNRKSPFRGDKLHAHHILNGYHNFSPSSSSTIIASVYFVTMGIGLLVSLEFSPLLGYPLTIGMFIAEYLFIGKNHWVTESAMELTPTVLFNSLRKKNVAVINTAEVDEFEIIIVDEANDEQEDIFDDSEDDKAA